MKAIYLERKDGYMSFNHAMLNEELMCYETGKYYQNSSCFFILKQLKYIKKSYRLLKEYLC
ncbi:hypothetical protein B5E87_14105 [Massilimicrobiota sp. An142]|uniref:hypothetical protein n=1 Tax=Clostridium sp. C1 TaxID=1155388 RepID=UPI000B37D75A|nr:hypothetical protein [Clostridium sp. C1]OUN37556.1 hypothetical protein B5G32_03785 [Massilimicrobiota sp. An80]OUQ09559.1 hypothetical protein B5E87_14105 [Massilimicrobiota sp. An142]OUQ25024.1 hypothetical protein B5E79_12220 [Massilimicrobiota sp. An134]OUQ78270.1 hypothetical protein B5E48_07400 [Massilimicrobiota sp. An105]QUN14246.1 hypothetical protein KEC48_07000 [Clostridium sp. C1]